MRKDLLLGIGATLIAMALFYYADHPTETLNIKKIKLIQILITPFLRLK